MIFQVSLQVLYIDASMTLKSFTLDITDAPLHKMTLSALDNTFDMCYRACYIQKAAFV